MRPLGTQGWTGSNTSRSIPVISAQPKWITFWQTPDRSQKLLDWKPKVKFHELVRIMVDADLELAGLEAIGEGRKILEERFTGWHRWDRQVISMER